MYKYLPFHVIFKSNKEQWQMYDVFVCVCTIATVDSALLSQNCCDKSQLILNKLRYQFSSEKYLYIHWVHLIHGFYLHENQMKKLWVPFCFLSLVFVYSTTIKKYAVCVNFLIDFNQTCILF